MHRQMWLLAWPMILSNITVPLLGLVDTAVIGHLPDPRFLGGVAIGASLFSILYWGFGFLRMGTTGHCAQAYGAGDYNQVRLLLAQSLLIAAGLGTLLILLQQPLIGIGLWLMDPSPEVLEQAQLYSQIRIYSAPAVLANYAILGWFLGLQNSKVPLALLVCANLINILLDLLLVLGLGWGVEGVALATLCADYAALALGLWLALQRLKPLPGQLQTERLTQWSHYRQLLQSNRYLLVRTLILLLSFAFFTAQGAQQGDVVLSANAVLLNFLLLISHGLDGFAHAIEALCGRFHGAGQRQQFLNACRSALLWSVATALAFSAFFGLAGPWLIRMLTDIPAVIATAEIYLPWLIAMPLTGVWSYLLDGIFIGANWFREMQNTMLLSALGVYLPVWYLSQPLGNHGLWLALTLLLLARGLSGGWVFIRNNR
ncbi:MAG: MATE family efflux transporter [Halopseudomonas sp.]